MILTECNVKGYCKQANNYPFQDVFILSDIHYIYSHLNSRFLRHYFLILEYFHLKFFYRPLFRRLNYRLFSSRLHLPYINLL